MNKIKIEKNDKFISIEPSKLSLDIDFELKYKNEIINIGRMAELVDALDSKSNSSNTVRVRFSLCPPFYEN